MFKYRKRVFAWQPRSLSGRFCHARRQQLGRRRRWQPPTSDARAATSTTTPHADRAPTCSA